MCIRDRLEGYFIQPERVSCASKKVWYDREDSKLPVLKEEQLKDKLTLRQVMEITGFTRHNVFNQVHKGTFPPQYGRVPHPNGGYFGVWVKDDVMSWCEERVEAVKDELLKRLSKNRDYLQLNLLQSPFEEMKWVGHLRQKKAHREVYKPKTT